MDVNRLIQFSANSTNTTYFGSTKANIDATIGDINDKPSANQAIFVDLENANITKIQEHINASAPIIFLVPNHDFDTLELENYLLGSAHKSPIYFAYGVDKLPTSYTHVKTSSTPNNNQIRKAKLQNIIGTINASKTFERERIAVITAPFDTFSVVPTAKTGANVNGIAFAALLECMRLVSSHPMANNWVFVFAVTDGRYCHYEGLERFVSKLTKDHAAKVEFAISLEDIVSETLTGHIAAKIKRDSSFAKFMLCLKDALHAVNITLDAQLSDVRRGQTIFGQQLINAVAITSQADEMHASITDRTPNVERANAVAWAVSEALLRMMYNADTTAAISPKNVADASHWAQQSTTPRMPQFRDRTFAGAVVQYMRRFGRADTDEWTAQSCSAPFSATTAKLVLYNKTPASTTLSIFAAAVVYGIVVLVVIGGIDNLKKFFA